MVCLNIPEYVEWLHTGENVKLWTAKLKAQALYASQHGATIPIYKIFSRSELEEERKIKQMENQGQI